MVVLVKTLQVILALSILIIFHEFGHFLFAKMFGIRVDKFYLFFDIGGKHIFSTKNNKLIAKWFPKLANSETDYGIGWLPLGGYCKICGMVDESMDTEQLKHAPEPWEYRSKPAWQRLLVVAGGVLFNFILAIVLYIAILAGWGESYISNDGAEIYVDALAGDMGFKNGDHIVSFDDYIPENFGMLQADLARRNVKKATVLRDGCENDIYIDQSRIGEILNTPGMFSLALPFVIDSIPPTSPNYEQQLLKKGDRLIALNGENMPYLQDSRVYLKNFADSTVAATIIRDCDTLDIALQVDTLGLIGVYTRFPQELIRTKDYNLLSAIPAGFKLTFTTIGGYLKDLKLVATPSTEAYKSVGSFIAIGQVSPSTWDWFSFINILALLSIILGVMNLIPIPGLDGGHIVFTIFEMITGRKPSDKFLMVAQMIGMVLLLMLMFLAFGNDISRLIH